MVEIMYNPNDVGREVVNNRGKTTKIRKYHMTDREKELARNKWEKEISKVDKEIKAKAGDHFFNPYRRGVYYYQIYSMFLLGANQWHSLNDIVSKMEEIMSNIEVKRDKVILTAWEQFRGKSSRSEAVRCKDFIGRIQENMVFFQRLNKLHPTGYKLMQVYSAVDMKRVSAKGFSNGFYYYRLSTYDSMEKALPIRDFSKFNFPRHEKKYINYKFIGTIITHDRVIEGKRHEMS